MTGDACFLCPALAANRQRIVHGYGDPQARVFIVGEAPGYLGADRTGVPFTGDRSGRRVQALLIRLGLSEESDPAAAQPRLRGVFISNVVRCNPPGNRNPAPEEILTCQGYLQQQIQHIQPVLIVALGRFAVQTLLQSEQTIGKLRGQVHQYQGIPLIATYHPAYLLRNLPDKAKAWQDMVLAKKTYAQQAG